MVWIIAIMLLADANAVADKRPAVGQELHSEQALVSKPTPSDEPGYGAQGGQYDLVTSTIKECRRDIIAMRDTDKERLSSRSFNGNDLSGDAQKLHRMICTAYLGGLLEAEEF